MATNRVVTKEELKKSGASSLREFLNKERGLTMKAPEGTKFGAYVPRDTYTSKVNAAAGKATVDKQDAAARAAQSKATDEAQKLADRGLDEDKKPLKYDFVTDNLKHGGSVKKMAKGGSASSRGDGIAQRGKTRGTMC